MYKQGQRLMKCQNECNNKTNRERAKKTEIERERNRAAQQDKSALYI